MNTEKISSVIVAFLYSGGREREPSSQVARIPPEFVMINPIAMAVARLVWGAALLALQVDNAGAEQYTPVIERNKLPYLTVFVWPPKYTESVRTEIVWCK